MGGRIDRIDLHRSRADIGDVVPSPRRNEHTPAVRNFLFEGQLVFCGSHLHPATASVEAQELIRSIPSRYNVPAGDVNKVILTVKDCTARIESDGVVTRDEARPSEPFHTEPRRSLPH